MSYVSRMGNKMFNSRTNELGPWVKEDAWKHEVTAAVRAIPEQGQMNRFKRQLCEELTTRAMFASLGPAAEGDAARRRLREPPRAGSAAAGAAPGTRAAEAVIKLCWNSGVIVITCNHDGHDLLCAIH